ncbi:hypothetical protein RN001_014489 [Aquatica leii]|uniref:Uncharacterized protein n=1 Tax=Aquatica leii TaxID=1421715 RepID=A0AAN7SN63_9COLE|nr:hypothetical protein RN001_014489 [Aquatica leii]
MIKETTMHRQLFDPYEFQHRELQKARQHCVDTYGENVLYENAESIHNSSGWFCPPYWDDILCWPTTASNTFSSIECPQYIAGFDKPMNNASRQCMMNGKWFFHEELHKYWTNYTQCFGSDEATVLVDLSDEFSKINGSIITEYLQLIKSIPRVGYTISLCTLIVAFIIMFTIKKLHCPRNNLHMNLFASFIFRAFLSLLKDIIFIKGVGLSRDLKYKNGETFFFQDKESNNWGCKLVTTLWEFFITANYSWILMEGLYLHNLIFRALFTDSSSKITHYIILGWGLPVLVIIPWVIARLFLENTLCWTTHDDDRKTFLIIRIPTMISIMINTVLFVKIAKVLFTKLRSSHSEEARQYQKWAKSTLVLVPLFGIHYALFLGMSYYIGRNEIVELTWLICDQLFASFQGFFVAILYCFLNGEVRTELKPHIHAFCVYIGQRFCCCGCFQCAEDDFKTIKSRSSVCTMLSSTSLYNGVNNHHRQKARWDNLHNSKSHTHYCSSKTQLGLRSLQDISPRKSLKHSNEYSSLPKNRHNHLGYYPNSSISAVDISACIDCKQNERCRSEPHLGMEMINMLPEEN